MRRRRERLVATAVAGLCLFLTGAALAADRGRLAPEVERGMASRSPQRVIIHLETGGDTKVAIGPIPGKGETRLLQAVDDVIAVALNEISSRLGPGELSVRSRFRLQPAVAAEVTAAALAVLAEHPRVRWIEPDRRWRLHTAEGLPLIGADILHDIGISGEGTAIAIIDTGIDYLHPTLGGGQIPNVKVVYGLDTADGDEDPMDCSGHGTAVASVAAGSSYQWSPNRRFSGGVAPAAKILAYKVTSDAECSIASTSAVVAAVEDAILNRVGDDYRLAAINLSLGGGAFSGPCDSANLAYATAVDFAAEAGVAVVASAGNAGLADSLEAPACVTNTISVGSVWDVDPGWISYGFCLDPECSRSCNDSFRWQRAVTCYSNSNAYLDVLAPAEFLRVADSGGVTTDFGGTSGAAAYVTGAVALLRDANPDLPPHMARILLGATGRPSMDDKNGVVRPVIDLATLINTTAVSVSADTDLPIQPSPHPPTVSSIHVDTPGPLGSAKVLVDLSHPQPDQLRLILTAPDGTRVTLHDLGPGSTPDPVFGARFDGVAGTYPDDLEPHESLGLLSGLPMAGEWTLTVEDHSTDDLKPETPALVGWALILAPPSQPAPAQASLVFPVVAHASGFHDTSWRSDVRLLNPSPTIERAARLYFVPAGEQDSSSLRQADVILPHRSVVALDDLVARRFGIENARGSLIIQGVGSEVLSGTSRTFTTGPAGSYGQFIAPVRDPGVSSTGVGEAPLAVLPTATGDYRINVGVTELTGRPATVAVTMIDSATGVAAAPSSFFAVDPFNNIQLNAILPDFGLPGDASPYLTVTVVAGQGRVAAYASVVDNITGDAVFVAGAKPVVTPALIVPVVAKIQGQAGTDWRSDLRVLNHGSFSVHVDAELRLQGAYGLPQVVRTFELRPGGAVTIDDVVGSFFSLADAVGSLRLVPREGSAALFATSRTANHVGDGSYGQYVPALLDAQGLQGNGVLLHLNKGPQTRCNVGIVETAGGTVNVAYQLVNQHGWALGRIGRQLLGPRESIQINDIFAALGVQPQADLRLEVARDGGDGAFFAYASVVDAQTGDAMFVPIIAVP